ncbi:TPR repeat-containing protein [Polaribacter sp. KT25b]|uniref:tetratricopeptide repeat protein n=1 Tax=Polaribacter sp. KT25b TaxID=1855336 RepID=UPI00087B101A|nr:tetratricopeptide repeat protein [Polaribacter sp. KT25b]SDS56652.1 TPR repeat-containing protein [Polaribacter sp. KT25b]
MKFYLNILILCLMFLSSTKILAQKDSIASQRKARSLVRQGNQLYAKEQYTDASVAYRKALDKSSFYDKASYNLGNALYEDKNFKEAVPQYELSAKTATDKFSKAEAYHNLGNSLMETKNYQGAVDAYKNSLRNNPNDDETRYNLAVAQKMLEKEKQDQKDDKNKDNKDKKDQDKKDKDDQDKKDKDKKEGDDKDKKDDKDKDGEGDKDQDKKQDPKKDDKKDPNEKPKPQKGKMSPEQIKQLLESLNNEEKKTQKKMNAEKAKGAKVKQEKDW